MGNSFIEDLIREIAKDGRFSPVEKQVIANRLIVPATNEERRVAYLQIYPEGPAAEKSS